MKFTYKAKTADGEETSGTIESEDLSGARQALAKKDFFVTEIQSRGDQVKAFSGFFRRVPLREKTAFIKEMSVMIKAGLPIVRALDSLQEQAKNPLMREVIANASKEIRGGETLSNSLAQYPQVFPELYTSLIASGEKSGNLDKVLDRLALDMEKSYALSNKIRGAMTYPIFVFVVMILILIAMLVFVLPQLKTLFEDIDTELPFTTKMLLASSDNFIHYWWIFLIVAIGLIWVVRTYYQTIRGKHNIDLLKIKVWLFGPINQKIYLAQFSRTLDTLIASGMPILSTFDILEKTVGNQIYAEEIKKARDEIEGGSTISNALSHSPYFPSLVTQLIQVGEESGKITTTLQTVNSFLENEVDTATKSMSSLIEPILIVIMGVGAGFIVTAIILPIYSLTNSIQ